MFVSRSSINFQRYIYIETLCIFITRAQSVRSQYHIFQYSSRKKKKHFKFLLFNLCFPFINKNDCQKNEFNNLSYYIINKEILRDEGEIKKRRTGVDRA